MKKKLVGRQILSKEKLEGDQWSGHSHGSKKKGTFRKMDLVTFYNIFVIVLIICYQN
jgi:hypothetical protein